MLGMGRGFCLKYREKLLEPGEQRNETSRPRARVLCTQPTYWPEHQLADLRKKSVIFSNPSLGVCRDLNKCQGRCHGVVIAQSALHVMVMLNFKIRSTRNVVPQTKGVSPPCDHFTSRRDRGGREIFLEARPLSALKPHWGHCPAPVPGRPCLSAFGRDKAWEGRSAPRGQECLTRNCSWVCPGACLPFA